MTCPAPGLSHDTGILSSSPSAFPYLWLPSPDMNLHLSSSVAPSSHPPNSSTGFLWSVGMPSTGPRLSLPSPAPGKNPGLSHGPTCTSRFGDAARLPQACGKVYRYRSLFRPLPQLGGHVIHWASSTEDDFSSEKTVGEASSLQVPMVNG